MIAILLATAFVLVVIGGWQGDPVVLLSIGVCVAGMFVMYGGEYGKKSD